MSPRCLEIAILLQRDESDGVAGVENADTTSGIYPDRWSILASINLLP
jgi:hypothetical protein